MSVFLRGGTLMYLMGHASITTTQKYLRLVDALKGADSGLVVSYGILGKVRGIKWHCFN